MSFSNLPLDLILLVLVRLPVISLGRFKTVSKSWNDWISSSEFIKLHLNHSPFNKNNILPRLIVNTVVSGGDLQIHSLELLIGAAQSIVVKNQRLHNPLVSLHTEIIGSCNGLICQIHSVRNFRRVIYGYRKLEISLCNPLTKSFWILPKIPNFEKRGFAICWYGFGYDDVNDDYKVMITRRGFNYKYYHEVYSLRSNAWCDVSSYLSSRYHSVSDGNMDGVLVNSVLHWKLLISRPDPSSSRDDDSRRIEKYFILAFDLRTYRFKVLPVPEVIKDNLPWSFSVLNGYLVLCKESKESPILGYVRLDFDLWMKDYGMKDSWRKITIRKSPGMAVLPPVALLDVDESNHLLNGKLVFYNIYKGMISLYDLGSGQVVDEFSASNSFYFVRPYRFVGSLVQPRPPDVH